ncbi:endoplasmic reticulum protein [Sanghuangporus baumii]|uniref:ER membrane protein complex subunit 4 n=1 Tax=Sanghuangporus baumii TaxID=108892 RepID=A0A9Q5I461_SANBA|nr:endoplasmic reticulum protein [Sanghuangporus baumii]
MTARLDYISIDSPSKYVLSAETVTYRGRALAFQTAKSASTSRLCLGSIFICIKRKLTPSFHFPQHSSKTPGKAAVQAEATFAALKEKRAWDLAISPAKQLPMQAFMLYMSGGGVQIFSMGIVFMLLFSPFKNLANINSVFAQFAPSTSNAHALSTLPLQKLVYLACNALTLALGLWKCKSMGLLPTGTGDWLAFETRGPAYAAHQKTATSKQPVNAAAQQCRKSPNCLISIIVFAIFEWADTVPITLRRRTHPRYLSTDPKHVVSILCTSETSGSVDL